jgi:integrase
MNQSLITTNPAGAPDVITVSDATARYVRASRAYNTRRAYRADLQDFREWCEDEKREHFPASPQTVADYLSHLANDLHFKVATIERRNVAISEAHKSAGVPNPTATEIVRKAMSGIRREHGSPRRKVRAVTVRELRAMCTAMPDTLAGTRDSAILCVQFAGAMRRSELSSLLVEDVEWGVDEVALTIRRSKTDQAGEGMRKVLPASSDAAICPVRLLRRWLTTAGIDDGAVFRGVDQHGHVGAGALTPGNIALVWKRSAERVGIAADRVSGHSARRGFITEAFKAEVAEADIQQVTGHKSLAVLRDYRADAGQAQRKAVNKVMG